MKKLLGLLTLLMISASAFAGTPLTNIFTPLDGTYLVDEELSATKRNRKCGQELVINSVGENGSVEISAELLHSKKEKKNIKILARIKQNKAINQLLGDERLSVVNYVMNENHNGPVKKTKVNTKIQILRDGADLKELSYIVRGKVKKNSLVDGKSRKKIKEAIAIKTLRDGELKVVFYKRGTKNGKLRRKLAVCSYKR